MADDRAPIPFCPNTQPNQKQSDSTLPAVTSIDPDSSSKWLRFLNANGPPSLADSRRRHGRLDL